MMALARLALALFGARAPAPNGWAMPEDGAPWPYGHGSPSEPIGYAREPAGPEPALALPCAPIKYHAREPAGMVWVSYREIAELLGISVSGAKKLAARENWPRARIGHRLTRIPLDAVRAYMERMQKGDEHERS